MRAFVLGRLLAVLVAVAAFAALAINPTPTAAQAGWPPAVTTGDFCTAAPEGLTCGEEVCFTRCMTPDEWTLCETKTWYADSYDHKTTAPPGATKTNRVRFFGRCGVHCAKMGSPRLAYWFKGGTLRDGRVLPGRWVAFPFSPPRGLTRPK